MSRAMANGISIEYETFGEPTGWPLLLISGFRSQLLGMDQGFCEALARRGFYVIRFDNRDVGLSSRVEEPYGVDDMAADAVGLLDFLGIPAAHVGGFSMGGMIAQVVAINNPARVLSLTSMASSLGGVDGVPPDRSTLPVWQAPIPTDRDSYIEYSVRLSRTIQLGDFDEDVARTRTTRSYDRSFDLAGVARQRKAVEGAPSRRERLGHLEIPALVVHGELDPLAPVVNAERTARAIPGAELLIIPGMGHYNAPRAWEQIADAMAKMASRATDPRTGVRQSP